MQSNIEKQLHILYKSEELSPEMFAPVVNRELFIKAGGGLFTSTYDETYGSGWVQWCLVNHFNVPEGEAWTGYILTPDKDSKVLTVDSMDDLIKVYAEYKVKDFKREWASIPNRFIDFEQIAKDYDAFQVTAKGEWETRYSHPLSLYGWDCESTHWFRWKFTDMEKIEKVKFDNK